LGGFLQLDYDASVTVMTPLARALDCSIEEAARGILRVATANMIRALRRVTVERGIDGRQCTLIAYGGAGPMHAVDVARSFGITQVVVPRASSVFSALGCLSAEMSYSQQQTIRMPSTDWQPKTLNDARLALRNRLSAPIIEAGHSADELTVEEVAAVRYSGQSYAVDIPSPDLMDQAILGRTFRQLHEQLYGFSTEEPWELSALRITVSLPRNQDALLQDKAPLNQPAQPVGTAPCYFGDAEAVSTPRYDREQLAFKQKLSGPVIIEDPSSTIVVPPGARLAVDPTGHLLIDITEASK
ncbi:MAG: hydantoinase/oxoprolinase family protein, partial [Gammaproteobacteria bacterium]|nr:hydantoinase/oxoprolinase family protein [Gammaproteobacteria bacterium]